MSNELQELMKNNSEWYKDLLYRDVKVYIKDNINSASRSFVAIGYYLKYVRDNELFKEDGYTTIWEFAQSEFSIGKSSASQFMSINDKFSVDGNSPILLEQYRDFTSSKLAEMLTMTEEQLGQVSPATTIVEIREIKKPVDTVLTSEQEPKPSNNCIHRPEFPCTLSEAQKVAQGDGEECNKKCCWGCPEHGQCGYECNTSAHRPKEPEKDLGDDMKPEPGTVIYGVGGDGKVKKREVLSKHSDFSPEYFTAKDKDGTIYNISVKNEHWYYSMDEAKKDSWYYDRKPKKQEKVERDETDPIETVEADIIQTEPEEVKQGTNYSINKVYSVLQKAKSDYEEVVKVGGVPEALTEKRLIIRDALLDYYQELRGRDTVWYQKPQPELPILRNNDQRKEFIDTYETWPIWINLQETGERYYRYDLTDKVAMVVKVSLRHIRGYGIQETDEISYGAEQYYLLGIKTEWNSKGTITVEDSSRTFYECNTNKSALVDYLKDFQKKGVNK